MIRNASQCVECAGSAHNHKQLLKKLGRDAYWTSYQLRDPILENIIVHAPMTVSSLKGISNWSFCQSWPPGICLLRCQLLCLHRSSSKWLTISHVQWLGLEPNLRSFSCFFLKGTSPAESSNAKQLLNLSNKYLAKGSSYSIASVRPRLRLSSYMLRPALL